MSILNDENFMELAIEEAKKALLHGDVPVGAIVVKNGVIIGRGHNMRELKNSACSHGEIIAIEEACKTIGSWNLQNCTLYVTLEPCPMCSGAILMAHMEKVVFGAYEAKFGAVGSKYNLFYDYKLGCNIKFCGGIKKNECIGLLTAFFNGLRS